VNCDETLAKLFGKISIVWKYKVSSFIFLIGRKRIRAFGMLKDLTKHMSDPDKQ
jgi:chromatin remodeling complex protein RSC6